MLTDPHRLPMADADVLYIPAFIPVVDADRLFQELCTQISWRQESIRIYGKTMPVPRLTAWHGDPTAVYTYSHLELHPQPWNAPLDELRKRLQAIDPTSFNSVLLNLYQDGSHSMGWHADDEPELGSEPVIASITFGSARRFQFRRIDQHQQKVDLELSHGSCLLMRGTTQQFWQHQVPKTQKPIGPRINLTFRLIVPKN